MPTIEELKARIREGGITQTNVAALLGVSQTALSHYFAGRQKPSGEYLERLTGAVNALEQEGQFCRHCGIGRLVYDSDGVNADVQCQNCSRPAPRDAAPSQEEEAHPAPPPQPVEQASTDDQDPDLPPGQPDPPPPAPEPEPTLPTPAAGPTITITLQPRNLRELLSALAMYNGRSPNQLLMQFGLTKHQAQSMAGGEVVYPPVLAELCRTYEITGDELLILMAAGATPVQSQRRGGVRDDG